MAAPQWITDSTGATRVRDPGTGDEWLVDERLEGMTRDVSLAFFWFVNEVRTANNLAAMKTSAGQLLSEFFVSVAPE